MLSLEFKFMNLLYELIDCLSCYQLQNGLKSLIFELNKFKFMLFVSDTAKKRVQEIKEKEAYGEDYFVRVSVTSGGCSGLSYDMKFDNVPQKDDQIFEDNGVKVVTDLRSFLYLCNTTLEFSGGLEGKGFYFNNPNASRTCACGESFSV